MKLKCPLIDAFDAERLVLDSVSLLEMMYDDQADPHTEGYEFTRSLKQAGVTTMLTPEASENNPYASRHGLIEYLADGVFVLQYIRSEFRETRLAVEIQKIRNANHARETKPDCWRERTRRMIESRLDTFAKGPRCQVTVACRQPPAGIGP